MKLPADKKSILFIGSSCADIIIEVDHLPKTAEDIHPKSHTMSLGGCAYNAASMARLLGADVTLFTPVGTGIYGSFVSEQLQKNAFPVYIRPEEENGCCYCFVEHGGERTFLSCHGAEYRFRKEWFSLLPDKSYSCVYVCGLELEEPTGTEIIDLLEEHTEWEVFYAPGPRGILIDKEKNNRIFQRHPILHLNEQESMELSQCSSYRDAAKVLSNITNNTVIITLGEKGCYCLETSGKESLIPPVSAVVTDTIGAGDSHIGALMASLSLGFSLTEALQTANKAASAVVGVKGSVLSQAAFDETFNV